MTPSQGILLAVPQGANGLLPVSSLGHTVVVPTLLGWNLNERDRSLLPFLVMLHVGMAVTLLRHFWRNWGLLLRGLNGRGEATSVQARRWLLVLVLIATIPAVLIGGVLENVLQHAFSMPVLAPSFLTVDGVLLLGGNRLRRQSATGNPSRGASDPQPVDASETRVWQCAALLPGILRSGAKNRMWSAAGSGPRERRPFLIPDGAASDPGGDRNRGSESPSYRQCRCFQSFPTCASLYRYIRDRSLPQHRLSDAILPQL